MSHHDWKPTARIQILEHRARLLWSLREFFHNQGILEIQTPVLSQDTVIDRHIDPLHLEGEQFGLP
jgi:lysyl-tRNA synthetase class 2